jgi:hypothetical protein
MDNLKSNNDNIIDDVVNQIKSLDIKPLVELPPLVESLDDTFIDKSLNNIFKNKSLDNIKKYIRSLNLYYKIKDDLLLIYKDRKYDNYNLNDNLLKSLCGSIFDIKTGKVLFLCNSYILDYDNHKENIDYNNIYKIEKMIDGTFIKLYYYNNEWKLSTNRSLDAYNSYWISTKSFGQLFNEVMEYKKYNYDNLVKNHCYSFIMVHPDNRNIINYYNNVDIYHMSTYDLNNNEEVNLNNNEEVNLNNNKEVNLNNNKEVNLNNNKEVNLNIGLNNIKELNIKINNLEELENLKLNNEAGYIIKLNNGTTLKLFTKYYELLKSLKGNAKDINYRCLILFINNKKDDFLQHFPEYRYNFEVIYNNLITVSKNIHNLYIKRYIMKQKYHTNKDYNMILYHLHNLYKETRIITTLKTVYDKILTYSPIRIYNLTQSKLLKTVLNQNLEGNSMEPC